MGRRGYFSSLGTGLSLVVAGVLVCAALIGAVAFNGFPELSPDPAPEKLVMPDVAAERATEREPVVLGTDVRSSGATTTATTAASRTRTRRQVRRARVRAQTRADGREAGEAPRGASPDAMPSVTVPDVPASGPRRADAPATVVEPVVPEVQTVVENVTAVPQELPAVPEAPRAAQPATDVVDSVVSGVRR